MRIELPSVDVDIPVPLTKLQFGELKHQPEDYQEEPEDAAIEPDDDVGEDEESYRPLRSVPGWRSLLRLSRALVPHVTIEQLEELECVDLFFLELVHFLVWKAPFNADTAGKLHCTQCGTTFVPLR